MTEKRTGFDKATGAPPVEVIDGDGPVDGASPVPRAVFTRENSIDVSKIQVSQLRIAQGQSAEVKDRKALSGQFVVSNFPANDSVILIPLGAANIRVYKPDPRAAAMCHAPTGDFGFGNPGGQCDLCPNSHWGEKNEATGRSKPPACKEGITVRFYSVTHRCMLDYQFMAGDRARGSFIEQQAMGFGWCGFAIEMTSATKENDKGSWSVPVIEMLPEESPKINDDQWANARKWFELFHGTQVSTKEQALIQLQAVN